MRDPEAIGGYINDAMQLVLIGLCLSAVFVFVRIMAHPQVAASEDGLFPGRSQTWSFQ